MPHKAQSAGGERRAAEDLGQAVAFEQSNQDVALPEPGVRNTRDKHQNGGED